MIQLTNLGFEYGAKAAVFNGLSLTIPAGRSVGILGANGVGKTTLIKLLSGLISPTEGEVSVLEFNPRRRETALYQDLYLVPEESQLPAISALAYIKRFSVFYPKFDHPQCTQLLAKFSVDGSKKLTALSLGQKKKFIIAFALSTGARVILMDEPTNGLDIPSKALFRDTVIAHQTEEQTLLICTHQVRDLESIIDSVVMMNEGSAHWFDLAELPNRISQVYGPVNSGTVLHSELRLGSPVSLVAGGHEQPTDIDLEMLFNTFHQNYSGLMAAVAQEQGL
ncbi:ABC transporter ATP-binding protein [Reinekea sp.]|jgi:ABC-2 type transport system ATP-binding protein|uniref:ABC transporter ATP-binding protein n=1 Tax=Reinekea sp. TaxID=1970455 RepID=UPI002A837ED8|nr:ABC transporter ATP-binding protein [Reinekea sp.]